MTKRIPLTLEQLRIPDNVVNLIRHYRAIAKINPKFMDSQEVRDFVEYAAHFGTKQYDDHYKELSDEPVPYKSGEVL